MSAILCLVLWIAWLLLLARVLLSWFPPPRSEGARSVVGLIYGVTEPVLRPIRRTIPPVRLGAIALDVSVIVLFIVILVLQRVVCG